jgi:hypothetical protein
VSREDGGLLSFSLKSKAVTQGVMCGWAQGPGIVTPFDWTFAGRFPSPTSEELNIILYSLSVLVEQSPYAGCLQRQKTNQH